MAYHAIKSSSGAKAWMLCHGKLAMEQGEPESTSTFADEGTAAHFLGAECLENNLHPAQVMCKTIAIDNNGDAFFPQIVGNEGRAARATFKIDIDMAGHVNHYVQAVRKYAEGGELLVEQQVPIGHITGEIDASGTADAIVLADEEIVVIDLKYGKGVEVSAEDNPQLVLYALGALEKYAMLGDFKRVRMVIIQPRVSPTPSEWVLEMDDLADWAGVISDNADAVDNATASYGAYPEWATNNLVPGEACRFCRAKGRCPTLRSRALTTVADDFVTIEDDAPLAQKLSGALERVSNCDDAHLDSLFPNLDLIEQFVEAVRHRIEARALAGAEFRNCKLVQGKRGNRKWTNAAEVEALFKSMRLKVEEMYDLSLISPTTADKLTKPQADGKPVIGPRQWPKVQALITQHDGKPTIAPISDKRPALVIAPMADEFTAIEECDLV
jgi:hypothetical protein